MICERPPVEHYARCSVSVAGVVVEPGLELREHDNLDAIYEQLAALGYEIGAGAPARDRARYCLSFGPRFEELWPGRAWFVEIHDATLGRWTQSYQPYGIPRWR